MDAQRDHFGRPLVIPPEGGKPVAYRRCTTFIDVLGDRTALEKWKQRQVAVGLTKRNDLMMRAAAAPDKKTLDYVCEEALKAAGSDASANIGTAVHALTERIDRGETPEIPAGFEKDIQAYLTAVKPLTMKAIEVFVVHDRLKVGGTFDRIVEWEGKQYVADLKTGSISFDGAKIAMQLSIYANSQIYDVATGTRTRLEVDLHKGLVIHLPQGEGKCSLHWADIHAGFDGVRLAEQVWKWRSTKTLLSAV
jgi:hypothetical protein